MDKQHQFNKACQTGDLNAVKRLINDPDVDLNRRSMIPVRYASTNNRREVVKFLLIEMGFEDMDSPMVKELFDTCDIYDRHRGMIPDVMEEIVREREAEAERERIRKRDAHIWDDTILF